MTASERIRLAREATAIRASVERGSLYESWWASEQEQYDEEIEAWNLRLLARRSSDHSVKV